MSSTAKGLIAVGILVAVYWWYTNYETAPATPTVGGSGSDLGLPQSTGFSSGGGIGGTGGAGAGGTNSLLPPTSVAPTVIVPPTPKTTAVIAPLAPNSWWQTALINKAVRGGLNVAVIPPAQTPPIVTAAPMVSGYHAAPLTGAATATPTTLPPLIKPKLPPL
jgi:hypothetical protein